MTENGKVVQNPAERRFNCVKICSTQVEKVYFYEVYLIVVFSCLLLFLFLCLLWYLFTNSLSPVVAHLRPSWYLLIHLLLKPNGDLLTRNLKKHYFSIPELLTAVSLCSQRNTCSQSLLQVTASMITDKLKVSSSMTPFLPSYKLTVNSQRSRANTTELKCLRPEFS